MTKDYKVVGDHADFEKVVIENGCKVIAWDTKTATVEFDLPTPMAAAFTHKALAQAAGQ